MVIGRADHVLIHGDDNRPDVIRTPSSALRVRPHLADYAAEVL